MNHPQDYTAKLSKNINNISNYACCAFTVLWWAGIEASDADAIALINDAIEAGVIEKDCTVLWVPFIKWLTGREITVEFLDIKSIRNIKEKTPVRFDYNGKSHWVGVENGNVVFNAKETSLCVTKGKPVTARIIKFK